MLYRNRNKAEVSALCLLVAIFVIVAAIGLQGQATQTQTSALAFPKHPKLSTPLAQVAHTIAHAAQPISADALPEPSRSAMKMGHLRVNAAGAVQVYIRVSSISTANLNALKSAGVDVQLTDARRNIVQAMVPAARLESVAALPFVGSISLPQYGYANTGSVTSQGDTVLKADKVRSQLGVTGKGIRVGVLSDGITGIFATGCTTCAGAAGGPISTGDIPAATGTRNASGVLTSASGGIVAKSFRASDGNLEAGLSGVGNEGTAMIEVVYDLAPGATFYFANFQTDVEFAAAMNWLAANTDVVVDDISFFDPPFDGTNAVSTDAATALNTTANPVRALITSVGNEAISHYLETYADSKIDSASVVGTTIPGYTGDFHLFQATAATKDVCELGAGTLDPAFLRTGFDLNVTLTWDDPYSASTNDYDLWLLDGTGKVVAHSANLQNGGVGGQPPIEFFDYVNLGPPSFFYIAITNAKNAATAKHLNLYVRGSDPIAPNAGALVPPATCPNAAGEVHNFNTPGSSVPAMGDAGGSPASVISVGAVPAANPTAIEPYSSQGPTLDGRVKPDITGVDLVQVTGAGGFVNPFWGTSAAAPHIAGIAALLLQSSPCLASGSTGAIAPATARTTLYTALTKNAFSLATPSPNNVFGYGLADALNSASTLVPVASAGGNQTFPATSASGASVTLDGSGSSDPSSCPLTYAWSGGCGTGTGAKPSLSCPMGNSTVTLSVSNNGGVTTSTATTVISVTDYSVGATTTTASVNSGATASYTVTVTPGGAFSNAVNLSCTTTAPKGVCTVTPTTVTPGSSPVNANVTVNTTGAAGGSYTVTVTAASNTLSHTTGLTLAVNDFATSATSTTATVAKGATATYTLAVGPAVTGGTFGSAVALTCTGAPSEATCTVAPASVTPGTASTAVTVTVTTTAQKLAVLHAPERPGNRFPALPVVFAMLGVAGIGIIGQRKSRTTMALVLLLLLGSIAMFVGCGGGGGSTQQTVLDAGTPSGTYTLVVTGTSGTLSHATNLTLTVQ